MAYSTRSNNGTVTTWHLEAKNPITLPEINNIEWLQADGDELIAVEKQFTSKNGCTIPVQRTLNIMRWYGDIAKTILFSI